MKKNLLFTPGPTTIPEDVLLEMARPIIHHRTSEFSEALVEVHEGIQWLAQSKGEPLVFAATGTGAMESSVVNLLSPGDTAVYVNGGKFGERWGKIGRSYGINMVEVPVEWGHPVRVDAVAKALEENPSAKAVFVQACETSTAVAHPVEELGNLLRNKPQLLVVDAITALGVWDIPMDDWAIDVLVSGSQKALMLPPGLSQVILSPKAVEANKESKLPKFYFDWQTELKKQRGAQTTAWTAAVTLVLGFQVVLKMMREETRDGVFARHAEMAELCRSGVQKLGLKLFSQSPANGVTSVWSPEGVDSAVIIQKLKDRFGITIANGQNEYKGKIMRIGHMGYYTSADVLQVLSALEAVLQEVSQTA